MDVPLFAEEEPELYSMLSPDCSIPSQSLSPIAIDTALSGDVPGPSGLSTSPHSNSTRKRPTDHKSASSSPAKRRQ